MRVVLLGSGPVFDRVFEELGRAGVAVVGSFDSLDGVRSCECDVFFTCDYFHLLPADFVEGHTVLNSHGGLLPRYRGFHGNGWAFINGDAEIGYTIHRVDATLDGGPVVYQRRFPLTPDATFSQVKAELVDDLVRSLPSVLEGYVAGELPEVPQDARDATFVGRRHLRDCYIDWSQPSEAVHRFVRALRPPAAPGAFTVFKDEKLVILETELYDTTPYREIPGHVVYRLDDRGVLVKTGDGVLLVKDVEYRGRLLSALELFETPGHRLGIDLVGEKLRSLGIV